MQYLGIEIGGTKLQFGIGADDGRLAALVRRTVVPSEGADGIRRQIISALPELLEQSGVPRDQLRAVGIGFGGPVDDATKTVIKSHQIEGWDGFPLADWVSDLVGLPAVLGNDADVAGLAEALHGAGKGLSPIFYITIGSGIGGGLIIDGEVFRGVGRGAAEIGHVLVRLDEQEVVLEEIASGWGIAAQADYGIRIGSDADILCDLRGPEGVLTADLVARAAKLGDALSREVLDIACNALAEAVCHVIALICPRRIVIGGGVSLLGEELLFEPLRRLVSERVFRPFAGLTDIVQAALGEAVVVHGAVSLAAMRLSERR